MLKFFKMFVHRGLMFAGFGPIVFGIVYVCLEKNGVNLNLSAPKLLLAIITTFFMAFFHAASSSIPQIESWSKVKAMFVQGIIIYLAYTIGYLINDWMPFNWKVLLIYTGCFWGGFLLVWAIILITVNKVAKKLNDKLAEDLNNQLNND